MYFNTNCHCFILSVISMKATPQQLLKKDGQHTQNGLSCACIEDFNAVFIIHYPYTAYRSTCSDISCPMTTRHTRIKEVSSFGHEGSAVEHVHTAEKEVVGIDQVIIYLWVLTCVCVCAHAGVFAYMY